MTFGIRTANDGTYAAITSGTEDVARFGGRNGDNSGQLAGFRNILLNPRVSNGVNQRGVANWAAVAIGAYGYDRWKKVDASTISQIIEAGNFKPSTVYTLSGDNVVTGQLTSPASGNWALPAIQNTADNVQLELGFIATQFELRPTSEELALCLPYYRKSYSLGIAPGTATSVGARRSNSVSANYFSEAHHCFGNGMHATPNSIVIYSTSGAAARVRDTTVGADRAGVGVNNVGTTGFFLSCSGLIVGNEHQWHYTAEAEL